MMQKNNFYIITDQLQYKRKDLYPIIKDQWMLHDKEEIEFKKKTKINLTKEDIKHQLG